MNLITDEIYGIISSSLNVSSDKINIIKKLDGALSNNMYLFEVNDKKYTFRIPGKNGNLLVDRDTEIEIIDRVKDLDLNVDLIYFNKVNGYKISKYIEGEHISKDNLDDELLTIISNRLKDIHSVNKDNIKQYDKESRMKKYEELAIKEGFIHSEKYSKIMSEYVQLNEDIKNCELVLSHGDFMIGNIVIKDSSVYVLDWEFAAVNDPYYDIACFGNQDFDLALRLLKVYVGNPTKDDYKRLYINRLYQCLQWHNVAAYKDKIGLSIELNVPFDYLTNMYLEKAEDFLEKIRKGVASYV